MSSCTQVLVGGPAFWQRLSEDIANARHSVCIQTLTFEGDAAGSALGDALISSRCADRRILVDSFNDFFQSDRFVLAPHNRAMPSVRAEIAATRDMCHRVKQAGVALRSTNPVGVMLHRMPARDHKKIVIIDARIAYVGGINFSDHNFAWHDMMVRIERADVAQLLQQDFDSTWRGEPAMPHARVGDMEILSLDGSRNEAAVAPLLDRIASARRSISVISPYMTFPFTDALRAAKKRGVKVTLLTAADNNRGFLNVYLCAEAARSGFGLRLYSGRMYHLKAMLIDDEVLVVGSSNFDWLTYHMMGEVMLLTSNRELIEQFVTQVLTPDTSTSRALTGQSRWQAAPLDCGMRCVAALARLICRQPARQRAAATGLPQRVLSPANA